MITTLKEFSEKFSDTAQKERDDVANRRYYYLLRFGTDGFVKRKSYHEVPLAKKNGGVRILQVPNHGLKNLQRQLLPFLSCGNTSKYAFAYVKGKSLLQHGIQHQNKPLLVKLDIENFFGSISFGQVFFAIDQALTNCPDIATEHKSLAYHFTQFSTLEGTLPQGAPTSPILSNLVFCTIDEKIASYCQKKGIVYTRYSDDLTFSGAFAPMHLISFVRKLLLKNGFLLNEEKTVIAGKGRQQKVTGIVVNDRPQTTKEYRKKIRQELYFIGKHGVDGHLKFLKAKHNSFVSLTESSYLHSLLGRICFVLQIDPNNQEFLQYKMVCIRLCHFYRVSTI